MSSVLFRVITLIRKEFLMILLDPKSRIVLIIPPIIQFFVFSYSATFDLQNVEFALLDESRTELSRSLVSHFSGSKHFELVRVLDSSVQAAELINTEQVRLVIHIPKDFADKIAKGEPATVQVVADGRNSNVASIALGYVEEIVQQFGESLHRGNLVESSQVALIQRSWFNRNMETRWFIVSALGGIISMVIVMILSSLSVAREREFGTFDQLLVSPFQPAEILIGKALPCVFFGFLDAVLLSIAAVYWFGVPFRGTVAALVLVLLAFMIAIVGVGLFVSAISVTMQQGLLGAFVFIMPAVLLGGFTTPISNMPMWLQRATVINPLKYVVQGLRDVFLTGTDSFAMWHHVWPLLLISVVTMPAAAVMFRYRTQ